MRRWILVMSVVAAAVVAGCSSISFKNPFAAKKGPEPEVLPAAEWAGLQRENAQRIRGEGIPREVAASGPVAAVRALDRSRSTSVDPIALKYLDDPNPLLRLEAAKALANIPDEKAVPALLRHLAGVFEIRGETGRMEAVQETRDVRVACADALRNFHTREVAAALVAVLKEKDFETPWQARKSLILMTGHDFRYDQGKWTDYLTKAANPFG